ncbi:MAG: CHC2 zinc finger domain-containing protein [Burkholderiaceae bacterium]
MSFNRNNLPEALDYYENKAGLKLVGRGPWRTTECRFHGGSDSMRVNTKSGAFKCMNCLIGGGDVLAYHMQAHGLEFVEAAKVLRAWTSDGKPQRQYKPTALSPREALEVIAFEVTFVAVAACNLARGVVQTNEDRARAITAAGRISRIAGEFQP